MQDASDPRSVERLHQCLLLLLVIVAIASRWFFLGAFPDVEADEGLWTNSAKNFFLFGDWFMDGRTHVFLAPVYHALTLVSFFLLGPSIEAARVVSVLAGVGSVALMYLVVLRAGGDRWTALVAAAVIALDQWAVILSRRALVESTQLFFALAAVAAILGGGRRRLVLGGAWFGLALLTKLNVAVLGLIFVAYLVLRRPPEPGPSGWRRRAGDVLLFGVVAVAVAAAGYGGLYLADPERFVQAFRFEMLGAHFLAEGETFFRIGRWGIAPILIGRSVIGLIREAPLLFSFAAVGLVMVWVQRVPGRLLFSLWAGIGLAFPLVQIFQPVRYFYLALPGVAFLAAVMMVRVAGHGWRARLTSVATVGIYAAFSLAYTTMNFTANQGTRLVNVESWVRDHTLVEETILTAGYFATNLPNRAYAHYHLAGSEEELLENIRDLEIDWVIWDQWEWRPEHRELLDEHFPRVHSFEFGEVYHTTPPEAEPALSH